MTDQHADRGSQEPGPTGSDWDDFLGEANFEG